MNRVILAEANSRITKALDDGKIVHVGRKPLGGDAKWKVYKGPRDGNPTFAEVDRVMRFNFPDDHGASVAVDCFRIGGDGENWVQVMPESYIVMSDLNHHIQSAVKKKCAPAIFTQDGQIFTLWLPEDGSVNDVGCYEGEGISSLVNGVRKISTAPIVAINLGEGFVPVVR